MAVRINHAGVRQLFSQNGQVGFYMRKLGGRVERGAERRAPKDTGNLKGSFKQRYELRGNVAVMTVSNIAPYAFFVHEPGVTRRWAGDPFLRDALDDIRGG